MNKGWVKLHRKLIDNPLLKRDINAYVVFTKLLLIVDRKTGSYDIGRFQLAELTGLKPTTAYAAVSRLRKAKMVTQVSNNKYTTISICKWSEYQQADDTKHDNKMTTTRQQDDTKQEVKKLRIKKVNTKVLTKKQLENRDPQVTQLISHFETNINPMPNPARQPLAAIQLIKQYGLDKSMAAINAVVAGRGKPYFPSIGSLEELRDKWTKLEDYYQRERTNNKETVFIS